MFQALFGIYADLVVYEAFISKTKMETSFWYELVNRVVLVLTKKNQLIAHPKN